jgi:hypothetical protein
MIDTEKLGDSIKPIIEDTIIITRDSVLTIAAELCDLVHENGYGADACADQIRRLRDQSPRPSMKEVNP